MEYILLLYGNEGEWAKQTAETKGQALVEIGKIHGELQAANKVRGGNALQSVSTATTVRVRNGKQALTDGPFAETKEQLGGYILIDAQDLNEAIAIAGRLPSACYGSVEVRPIMKVGR